MLSALARRIRPLIPASIYRSLYVHVARRNSNRWLQEEGVLDLALQVGAHFDYTVQAGPFKGMRYTRSAVLSCHATPFLLGQYERQIYPSLMEAANRTNLVIDIGHAEGYYAVGMAILGKKVSAFDADSHERRVCREMAEANKVASRISIRRWCDGDTLREVTRTERPLIICDIDGGELELFTPEVISDIGNCALIVELHARTPRENEPFLSRFLSTHQINIIDHPSEPSGVELIDFLGADAPRMATEYRDFQQWMVATPKQVANRDNP